MFRWYAVHARTGHERKVARDIRQRLDSSGLAEGVREIAFPTHSVREPGPQGRQVVKEKPLLAGYLLVRAGDEHALALIRATKGVLGWAGGGDEAIPMRDEEALRMLGRGSQSEAAASAQRGPTFKPGQRVRVISGPLSDFEGAVSECDEHAQTVTVDVQIFGRATPAVVAFADVRAAEGSK